MLPLLWISALALFNLTYSLSFSLRLESTTIIAVFSLLVGAPFLCLKAQVAPTQMLHLMHLVAQEHTQLNKTLLMLKAVSGWRDLSKLFPAPQQSSQHRSSACSEWHLDAELHC